jgi:cyanophycinase
MTADIGRAKGILVAVGGAEDRTSGMKVLRTLAGLVPGHAEVVEVIPTASGVPEEMGRMYEKAFGDIGVGKVRVMDIRTRADAGEARNVRRVEDADIVFFTGGDQLRLTSVLGGSPVLQAIRERYQTGGIVAGTSAGAAAMTPTMIFERGATSGALQKGNVQTTPGLGLLHGAVIDTHFIDRGRFSRLLEVVAANPDHVGLGLGEDTGIIVRDGRLVEVIGTGLVVVVDGHQLRFSNISRAAKGAPIVVENMVVHTLAEGYGYDLAEQRYLLPDELAEVLEVEA